MRQSRATFVERKATLLSGIRVSRGSLPKRKEGKRTTTTPSTTRGPSLHRRLDDLASLGVADETLNHLGIPQRILRLVLPLS